MVEDARDRVVREGFNGGLGLQLDLVPLAGERFDEGDVRSLGSGGREDCHPGVLPCLVLSVSVVGRPDDDVRVETEPQEKRAEHSGVVLDVSPPLTEEGVPTLPGVDPPTPNAGPPFERYEANEPRCMPRTVNHAPSLDGVYVAADAARNSGLVGSKYPDPLSLGMLGRYLLVLPPPVHGVKIEVPCVFRLLALRLFDFPRNLRRCHWED
mmetsp:Transcript_22248/g.46218  ORF Transcript_22248/g.46218 Transcript_22248/m.46218 type:complete len:210 (-) Transcript_22248:52-681(-)